MIAQSIPLVTMVVNFTQEQIKKVFTNEETTEVLLNGGYRPEFIYGFHTTEIVNMLHNKYKGDVTITHKKEGMGFVALFNDEEVFDSAIFDKASPLVNAFGHLLLILDNKFDKKEDV